MFCFTFSSQSISIPAVTNVGASFQQLAMSCASNQSVISSSRSLCVIGSSFVAVSARAIASFCNSMRNSFWAQLSFRVRGCNACTVSRNCPAALLPAEAGLFNSCASPAAKVPNDTSFSRCCDSDCTACNRSAIVRRMLVITQVQLESSSQKAAFGNSKICDRTAARPAAQKCVSPINTGNSPYSVFGLYVANKTSRSPIFWVIRISPSSRTKTWLAGSP